MNFIEILHILPPILNKYHLLLLTEGFFFHRNVSSRCRFFLCDRWQFRLRPKRYLGGRSSTEDLFRFLRAVLAEVSMSRLHQLSLLLPRCREIKLPQILMSGLSKGRFLLPVHQCYLQFWSTLSMSPR